MKRKMKKNDVSAGIVAPATPRTRVRFPVFAFFLLTVWLVWLMNSEHKAIDNVTPNMKRGGRISSIGRIRDNLRDIGVIATGFTNLFSGTDNGGRPNVKFVPYPHKALFRGGGIPSSACTWETRYTMSRETLASLLGIDNGRFNGEMMDHIQQHALSEGVCVPIDDTVREKTRLFSAAEARTCLKDSTIAIAGDSFNRNLYIALGDILLEKPSNVGIKDATQRGIVAEAIGEFTAMERMDDPSFPALEWICSDDCGKTSGLKFSDQCSDCINSFSFASLRQQQVPSSSLEGNEGERRGPVVIIAGSGLHMYNRFLDHSVVATSNAIKDLVTKTTARNVIFASVPSTVTSKDPGSATNVLLRDSPPNAGNSNNAPGSIYWETLLFMQTMAKNEETVRPFLDFFHLTHSCFRSNCTAASNDLHKSRFVNRWKAQVLLNMICDDSIPEENYDDEMENDDNDDEWEYYDDVDEQEPEIDPTTSGEQASSQEKQDEGGNASTSGSSENDESSKKKKAKESSSVKTGSNEDVSKKTDKKKAPTGGVKGESSEPKKQEEEKKKSVSSTNSKTSAINNKKQSGSDNPSGAKGSTNNNKNNKKKKKKKRKRKGVGTKSTKPTEKATKPITPAVSEEKMDKKITTKNRKKETAIATKKPPPPPKVVFVPYPHRSIGLGKHAMCDWAARDPTNVKDRVVSSLLGPVDIKAPDIIQKHAFSDTICIPESDEVLSKLHLFSSKQGRECLSNITLAVAGDSYSRQLFIELDNFLFGNPSNVEIQSGSIRNQMVKDTAAKFIRARKKDKTFPGIHWICHNECYGMESPFWKLCSDCIKKFRGRKDHKKVVVPVIGAAVHIMNHHNLSIDATLQELDKFHRAAQQVVYTSTPAYDISRVPSQYKTTTMGREKMYWGMLPKLKKYDIRYLDFFQMTHTCFMDNCTYDGGHRSRFVNRWKIQLLLNTLCQYG